MKIKIKLSGAFEKYLSGPGGEFDSLSFDNPVPVKIVLEKLMIPHDLPKLILINGRVKNQEQILEDGDTLTIFPKMSGG